jgi:predicted ATP-grasp superfamily ATP-dependent carboligase
VLVVRDEHELDRHLTSHARQGAFPIVQEFLPDLAQRFYCFAVRGELVAAQQWRLIRSFCGRSVLREHVPVDPDLYRYTALLMKALQWEGIAGLEFKVRESDGDARYIETNARPWSTFEGSIAVGWDFPVWMHDYFLHGEYPEPPPPGHALGKRARWLYGDLYALVDHLGGGQRSSWRDRGRAGAILDYLRAFSPGVHPDVFTLDDPLPELAEHARGAKSAARHVARRSSTLRRAYRFLRRTAERT